MARKTTKNPGPTTNDDNPYDSAWPYVLIGDHPTLGRACKVMLFDRTPPRGMVICEGGPQPHFVAERVISPAEGPAIVVGRFDDTHALACGKLIRHRPGNPYGSKPWMSLGGPIDPGNIVDVYIDFVSTEDQE